MAPSQSFADDDGSSRLYISGSVNIIDGHIIALMELKQGKIPFIIRRPMPNGGSEYWKVNDLKIIS